MVCLVHFVDQGSDDIVARFFFGYYNFVSNLSHSVKQLGQNKNLNQSISISLYSSDYQNSSYCICRISCHSCWHGIYFIQFCVVICHIHEMTRLQIFIWPFMFVNVIEICRYYTHTCNHEVILITHEV